MKFNAGNWLYGGWKRSEADRGWQDHPETGHSKEPQLSLGLDRRREEEVITRAEEPGSQGKSWNCRRYRHCKRQTNKQKTLKVERGREGIPQILSSSYPPIAKVSHWLPPGKRRDPKKCSPKHPPPMLTEQGNNSNESEDTQAQNHHSVALQTHSFTQ